MALIQKMLSSLAFSLLSLKTPRSNCLPPYQGVALADHKLALDRLALAPDLLPLARLLDRHQTPNIQPLARFVPAMCRFSSC